VVNFIDLNSNLVSDVDSILRSSNTSRGQLLYRDQALASWKELYKGASAQQSGYRAVVLLADIGIGGEIADHLLGELALLHIRRGDVNAARLLDVDLGASGSTDLLNDPSSWPYDLADALRIDLDNEDTWCVLGQAGAWRCDRCVHRV